MARTAPTKADILDAIIACLREDSLIAGCVNGRVVPVGQSENLPHIEIGLTEREPTFGDSAGHYLLSVHLWSNSEIPENAHAILEAAEQSIAACFQKSVLEREHIEVRYDERASSFHGLLRISIEA